MLKQIIYSMSLKKQYIVVKGEYKGCKYAILSLGRHPVAYVEDFLGLGDYCNPLLESIVVHGGFTYYGERMSEYSDNSNYLGWDYGHYGDYSSIDELLPPDLKAGGKKWTTEEILEEVYSVIIQLKNIAKKMKIKKETNDPNQIKGEKIMKGFRVYDTEVGKYVTDELYWLIDSDGELKALVAGDLIDFPHCIREDKTGLIDKNGKKIFEGDIILTEFGQAQISFNECRGFGGYSNRRKSNGGRVFLCGCDLESGCIVGNIHDNPELLEEEE